MSRFDADPDKLAEEARQLDEQTTKKRASYDGGSPSVDAEVPGARKASTTLSANAVSPEEPTKFHIRANLTFTEDDPVGRALAERLRAMPEASRKHYSSSKAVREAIMADLEGLSKRL